MENLDINLDIVEKDIILAFSEKLRFKMREKCSNLLKLDETSKIETFYFLFCEQNLRSTLVLRQGLILLLLFCFTFFTFPFFSVSKTSEVHWC